MKYIIIKDEFEFETPVLFGENLNHSDVAKGYKNVVSAGFVRVDGFNAITFKIAVKCYSESETLKMKPRDCDDEIIEAVVNGDYNALS